MANQGFKWFLLLEISYEGRILIINNLLASALWHHLACIGPLADALMKIQSILIDFFFLGQIALGTKKCFVFAKRWMTWTGTLAE